MDLGSMPPISVKNCKLDSYLEESQNPHIAQFLGAASNYLDQDREILVDVKFHDPQVGGTPALPGWHVDGSTLMGRSMKKRKEQYLLYVVGDSAMTEFCLDRIDVDHGPKGLQQIAEHRATPARCFKLRSGFFVTYDSLQMHRATQAEESGKRLLIRLMASDTILGLPYERAIFNPTIR